MPPASRTPARPTKAPAWLALLRGINVGGRNVLPMAELARLFVEAGCVDVQTYIQSGNVLFAASSRTAATVAERVSTLIRTRFDLRVPIVVRSSAEVRRAVAGNPFVERGVDPATLHLLFLADEPEPRRVALLDPAISPGDAFVLRGREVFLHLPSGVARTKLSTAYFDAKLATTTTQRNWRTVLALAGMMEGAGRPAGDPAA